MKKLKLQTLGLSVNELLTREQLKKVMGGSGGSGASGTICGVVSFNSGGQVTGGYYTPDGSSGSGYNGKSKDDAIAEMNAANNNPDFIYNGSYARYCCDSCGQYF